MKATGLRRLEARAARRAGVVVFAVCVLASRDGRAAEDASSMSPSPAPAPAPAPASALAPAPELALAPAPAPAPTPIDALGANAARVFTGDSLLFYAAAVADTAVMAFGDGDHRARVALRTGVHAQAWGDAAYLAGYVLPVVVAPAVWATGALTADRRWLRAGSAAVQALALTAAVTVILKWSTGRPYPLHGGDPNAPDVLAHPEYARAFSPFNFRGDWAWPSGHTAAITSVVAAIAASEPDSLVVPLVGYPVCAAIGVGMIAGDHHWTSDVISGGLIGFAIGSSVGKSFRRRATGKTAADRGSALDSLRLVPMAGQTVGAAVAGTW